MQIVHHILVRAPEQKKARTIALAAVAQHRATVRSSDRRIPAGWAGSYRYEDPEFNKVLQHARMLQGTSLLSVYTTLANSYGRVTPKEFEETYLHDPDSFKKIFGRAFRFMGECAADVLLDRRCPRAIPGEDWNRGDFNLDGFLAGLETMAQLNRLLKGEYCPESYYLDSATGSGFIPNEEDMAREAAKAAAEGYILALVPIRVEA